MRHAARALLALLGLPLAVAAAPEMGERVWTVAESRPATLRIEEATATYRYGGALPKSATDPGDRRTRVGFVLASPKDFSPPAWRALAGGFVARFDVNSPGAQGLRVRLALSAAGAMEVRVRGEDGRVEAMAVAAGAQEAWGPWTAGATQAVEVFARERPAADSVRLADVVHFDRPLETKAAAECTVDASCSTGSAILDEAIARRKASIARISFVDGGRAFVCTGTLINTEKFPTPYFLTANHCVDRAAVAASVTSLWFHEATACGSGATSPNSKQVAGGMTIEFADPNTDNTLLVMNANPPAGATYSGWNAARLATGELITSLSHPTGDVLKLAQGRVDGMVRFDDWEQAGWLVGYSRGIIQGGSSGSGLFTLSGGSLQLRGVLSASTTGANGSLSCTNLGERGVYSRLDVFYPQVARRLMANPPPVADDHGDRHTEATPVALGETPSVIPGRIDYLGDTDVFRVSVPAAGTLIVRSSGGMDTVGVLLNANGERLASNDDAQTSSVDFGLTQRVGQGTYYVAVTRWESAGTGPYSLSFELSPVTENHTDLWWNPEESGWGINFTHQGEILFATLFTYGGDGEPDWFAMSRGERQEDGSYLGDLYRARGPVFYASPWSPIAVQRVGTMRVAFAPGGAGTLSYTVDGVPVVKQIQRQRFSTNTTCSWSAFDRSFARNFQDLWWNPAESGWGINFTHQGDIIFATLFTYGADGRPLWFVMSRGDRVPQTRIFAGTLYRTAGPPFDANPWRPITFREVGTMQVEFTDGNSATLVYSVDGIEVRKQVIRQVFAVPAPECESDD
jgi:hypothetical protein